MQPHALAGGWGGGGGRPGESRAAHSAAPRAPTSRRRTPTPRPRGARLPAPGTVHLRPRGQSVRSPSRGKRGGTPGPPLPQDYLAPQPALCPLLRHRRAAAAAPGPPQPPLHVARLPRRGPGREGAWRRRTWTPSPPAVRSGDTWSPTRLALAASKHHLKPSPLPPAPLPDDRYRRAPRALAGPAELPTNVLRSGSICVSIGWLPLLLPSITLSCWLLSPWLSYLFVSRFSPHFLE